MNITLNEDKQGIEVRFDEKPSKEILEKLKDAGFRWSNRQKMWYAKQSDDRLALLDSYSNFPVLKTNATGQEIERKEVLDLWGLTRAEKIEKHPESNLETKEIAAIIRKHFRSRFPMFKFSVTSDFNSISAHITASPYEKDSDEVKAVLAYMGDYIESYKENSRYSFYGGRNYPSVYYDCTFREMTVSDMNIREKFQEEKQKWEIAEEERKAAEFEAYLIQEEERRIEREKIEAEHRKNHDFVEQNVVCEDVDYFVINAIEPGIGKECSIEEYEKEYRDHSRRVDARIIRNVQMAKEVYDIFSKQLMDSWSFIEKTGGSATEDCRVNSMKDYQMMTKEERESVSWYSDNCVAIYCDGELKNVVDAQGYDYCRYVFLIDSETVAASARVVDMSINDDELANNKFKADVIEDVSTSIITKNSWEKTWNKENQLDYLQSMKEWFYSHNYRLTKGAIQQIKIEDLKNMMYRLIIEMNSIVEQFDRAALSKGQKITIMRIGDMGGFIVQHASVDSVEFGKYAQYDKAVKLIFKPRNKRKLYYNWYHGDMMVVDGWVDIPDSVLWDIKEERGMIIRSSKFLSCDMAMYAAVEEYLMSQQIVPIINTYNPDHRK